MPHEQQICVINSGRGCRLRVRLHRLRTFVRNGPSRLSGHHRLRDGGAKVSLPTTHAVERGALTWQLLTEP